MKRSYILVENIDPEAFQKEVSEAIQQGYSPLGPPQFLEDEKTGTVQCVQAMVAMPFPGPAFVNLVEKTLLDNHITPQVDPDLWTAIEEFRRVT